MLTQVGAFHSYNGGLNQIIISDINQDGVPDVVVGPSYRSGFFLRLGAGLLQPTAIELGTPPITTYAVSIGDFNNDGSPTSRSLLTEKAASLFTPEPAAGASPLQLI